MSGLDFLFNGAPPPSVTGSVASQQTMPDWYQQYIRGIAAKATSIAGQPYQAYPGQRVADFNDDQQAAFSGVRANQGVFQPALNAAQGVAGGIAPGAQDAGAQANAAVAGPAQTFPDNFQKYMSPYTSSVVNEIGRLGNQNLQENIIPGVQSQFIGGGGFGSTRNADILGRSIRDAQTNISGLQSQALQSGFGTSAGIFANDANRAQQQQGMQGQTALGAGQLGVSGATAGSQQLGALGQMRSQLGNADASALAGIGQQQQQLEQTGYDTGYNEFLNQRGWDWNQLNNVSGAIRGQALPTGQVSTTNQPAPGAGYSASPLQWMSALYGMTQQP